MADDTPPPPPPGFKMDAPPPPPGFKLDDPVSVTQNVRHGTIGATKTSGAVSPPPGDLQQVQDRPPRQGVRMVSEMPRRMDAKLAQGAPDDRGPEDQGPGPQLRGSIQAPGKTGGAAVPSVRGESRDASPRLQQAAGSRMAVPPPPPGFALDKAPQQSTVGKIAETAGNLTGVLPFAKEYRREAAEGAEAVKGDFTAPVQGGPKQGVGNFVSKDVGSKGREKPGVADYAARAGKTALDVANEPMIPATAAITTLAGRPIEKATGGAVSARTVGDLGTMAIPFAGDIKAAATGAKAPAAVKDAYQAFEKVTSPTTVSKEAGATEKVIRRATGEGSLEAERAASKLLEDNKLVGNLPVQEQRAMVDYIENRSKGAKLADPRLQASADKIGQVYDSYKTRIQSILPKGATPKFIDDYYTHLWKDKPNIVAQKMGAYYKQGSGRNLKLRTIPTIADGIKAGLTPVTENPIEATSAYAQNMSRFLATHDMQNELKAQGYAKWFSPGSKNLPKGWVPLDGILTEKVTPGRVTATGTPTGKPIKLFAPPDVARVYNNFISKGFEQGDAGPLFTGARHLANGLTMLKLGLSTFHLDTMANESITSGFARAYKSLSRGDVGAAAKSAGKALGGPVIDARRGMKMQQELLGVKTPDALSSKVNDAFVRSGGRLKMDPFYRTRASGSFFNAWEKGTLKRELKDAATKMYKGTPYENAKGVVDNAANIIQTTAAPLFEKYIPAVKRGAFASSMEDFIKANPQATQSQLDDYAVKLSDSIDNRFGELVQDNLFWKRQMKQIAQLVLLSPTWDLGTIREIGGGLKDIPGSIEGIAKGKGISDRTAYVAGLASEVALKNAVYNYLKTGTAPQGKDYAAGRTGGTDIASGKPERVITPGYEKDVYAFGYDFPHNVGPEIVNKLNPALTAAIQMGTNKDYRGLPIYRPEGVAPQPGDSQKMMDYLTDTLMPISIGQFDKGKKGTNIGPTERALLADRPAPSYMTDPQRVENLKSKYNTRDWRARIRSDARAKANEE